MIAIIPARGGSKRLPGKNIKLLNGKPLIVYTIEAALKCKDITKVIVTTDDKEIAEVSERYGAIVPGLRPSELSNDTASSNDVIKYIVKLIEIENDITIDSCVLLQPTSPFRNENHIEEAISLYKNKGADSVISFTKEHHPLSWNKFINSEGIVEDIGLASKETFYPNGAIYVLSKKVIENGLYYTEQTYGYIMDRMSSIDIDTKDDWMYCCFIVNNKNEAF
ncbi:N-Acetylneuraminate cytidylyltransferase [Myroides odoratimimus]|uniref:acylneuraminate cytidylyltransferase family protein n=1 Tax=Myroides odoratimimus TaxID=76832 RepID=UPI0007277039|nr:acylneuraminate cytidylyltransferase family protein [Myroides odoratimimus]GAQ14821.1 N-Acetylneuraminate cytidylyltransferase [Myroides odoratimimus]STZ48878.1 N-acylneuraminate cytidylyltransferase [Myroides odoratimimus]